MLVVGIIAMVGWTIRSTRRLDDAWVARQLDDRRPDLEDSAGLLLRGPEQLNSLQRLQRTRLERRLVESPPPDLRPAWPGRALALSWAFGAAITTAALLAPPLHDGSARGAAPGPRLLQRPPPRSEPQLVERHLDIEPPAYTGLPTRSEDTLDAKLPAGSRLRWRLAFEPQPALGRARLSRRQPHRACAGRRRVDGGAPHRPVGAVSRDRRWRSHERCHAAAPPRGDRRPAAGDPRPRADPGGDAHRGWPAAVAARVRGERRLRPRGGPAAGHARAGRRRERHRHGAHDRSCAAKGDARQQRYAHRLDLAPARARGGRRRDRPPRRARQPPTGAAVRTQREPDPPLAHGERRGNHRHGGHGAADAARVFPQPAPGDHRHRGAGRGARQAPRRSFPIRSDAIGMDQRLLRLRYGQFLGEEVDDGPATAHDDHEDEAAGAVERLDGAECWSSSGTRTTSPRPPRCSIARRASCSGRRSARCGRPSCTCGRASPGAPCPTNTAPSITSSRCSRRVASISRAWDSSCRRSMRPAGSRVTTGGVRSRGDPLVPAVTGDALPAALWQQLGESVATDADACERAATGARGTGRLGSRTGVAVAAGHRAAGVAIDALINEPPCEPAVGSSGRCCGPCYRAGHGDRAACDGRPVRHGLPRGPGHSR